MKEIYLQIHFRIDINFHKGASSDADLPLHLSIRFDEGNLPVPFSCIILHYFMQFISNESVVGKMVYNSYMEGIWSNNEQRLKNLFKPNTEFDIRIRIINNKYQAWFPNSHSF